MAIPNNYIDKITNKDSGESRIISPAADKVRVDNENFEGTDLDKVLDEVAQAIGESGSGDGTVTGVKVGNNTYEPTDGVVDMSTPFAGKVDKNGTDSLMTAAEHTKLQNLPTADQLTQQMGTKANDNAVVKSISVNGTAQQKDTNGNVNISVPTVTFDDAPTAGSDNAVKSKGIKTALDNLLANIHIGQNGNWYVGQTDTGVKAQGPTGNVSISDAQDILTYIVNDLITGGGNNILSAEQGKILNMRLEDIEDEVINVEEDGFYIVDEYMNVAFSVTDDGIDAIDIGEHLENLVGKTYAGQCVVRFLPFLSAWNNAVKDSLCLCATKQQIVNNKIPFYDGFLFHKLPTDDKSLWYGTTLDNAVQIGTVNFTPKNCLLAMSPTDGRVIATVRGDRGDIHVWDGTTDHTVAAVTSDGNNRKAMGWLYNSGVDFIKDGNNVERCVFAEYDGSVEDKGGFYVWVGTYPYTNASNWKTTLHKPLQYYGTIQDGTITHFHQIRRDPWTNILYLTSGDQPGQLVWWYSTDYGDTWTELTNNKTNGWEEHVCRLINFCFTDEWIYWATDHGTNHCLNRIKRNAQTGVIDPSTREKLCDLPFAQACNSICLCESPKGIFMYERIDTGTEYESYYGSKVKMLFWSIPEGKLYTVAELGLTNNSWGGSRGKCYLNYTNGQQPRPAMGFSDDTRCYFDIVGADNTNIGTIFYEL